MSAGAAFACAAIANTTDDVVRAFVRRTDANRSNFYLSRIARRRSPFPHHEIYRGTLLETIDDTMIDRVRNGPEIRVLLAHPPRNWAPAPAVALGLVSYRADCLVRRSVHPRWPKKLGFRSRVVNAQSCRTPDELADLILQSSCLPPIVPILHRDGEPVVDGAVIDSVPVDLVSEFDSTLVLLTRQHKKTPTRPGVRYLQPSSPIPIELWDYASPDRVQATFDLGRRDGEVFARELSQTPRPAAV